MQGKQIERTLVGQWSASTRQLRSWVGKAVKDKPRVLIVDDYADSADSLAAYLRLIGYVTQTVSEGAAALAVMRDFMPHCVLLDVNMPGMDGFELARHLKAQFREDVVLVAVTGGAPGDDLVKVTFGIVDYYLQKPISEADRLLGVGVRFGRAAHEAGPTAPRCSTRAGRVRAGDWSCP